MTELNLKFDYRPHPVSRVCYGKGRLEELGNLLRSLEGKRALLVTSPSIKQAGLVDRAEKILGHDLAGIFDQTLPHSPIESVQKAVDLSKGCGADAVISLGGGSQGRRPLSFAGTRQSSPPYCHTDDALRGGIHHGGWNHPRVHQESGPWTSHDGVPRPSRPGSVCDHSAPSGLPIRPERYASLY
jgi:hypothetical protein